MTPPVEGIPTPGEDPITVLHVDDDPEVVDVTGEALEGAVDRIEVVTETDPTEAVGRVESEGVDCVVSNYRMPGMDGLELLDAVRERDPDLPFILFTGEGSEDVASEAIGAGVDDYLQKDAGTGEYELLANRITNAVEGYRAAREHERVHQGLEAATEGVGILDAEGRYVYVNRAYADLYGYEPADLVGEHWETLYPEDEAERFHERVLPELDETGEWSGRSRGVRADGTTFEERLSLTLLDDGGHICVVRDVTDWVELDRELEARSAAIEAAADGIAIIDADGKFEFVNRSHAEVYGYDDPEAFVGRPWKMCYSGDELKRMEERVEPTLYADGEWRGEAIGTRKDGSTFPEELTLTVMDEGKVVRVVRDVTERKRREADLRETNRLLEGIMDTTPAAVFAKDREGRYRLMNGTCREVYGLDDERVVGRTDHELFPEETADRYRATDEEVLRTEETIQVEHEVTGPDGTRTFLTLKSPLFDQFGDPIGICGVATEITDRVEYEREIERQNERLDKFTRIVSHDLRNPLQVAKGWLEFAQEDGDGDGEYLDTVADALDEMERIIDDTLLLARQGQTIGEKTDVRIEEFVTTCWERVETGEADLVVDGEATIRADPSRLRHVFRNLFRNAVVHADGTVTVRVGTIDGRGLYVADDGPGVPPEDREEVFEPGYTTAEDGTGFGLAIVGEIVEAHGWEVGVTESDAGGARFEITGVDLA